jgi:hypothetical protein
MYKVAGIFTLFVALSYQESLAQSYYEPGGSVQVFIDPTPDVGVELRVFNATVSDVGHESAVTVSAGDYGSVTYVHSATNEDSCGDRTCPDIFILTDWPDGLIPLEERIEVDENDHGTLYLIKYLGA